MTPSPLPELAGYCSVSVTYGDRAGLCIPALNAVFETGVQRAVVVLNGATPSAVDSLHRWNAETGHRVTFVDTGSNLGSAAGYRAGILAALDIAAVEWLWLLDDDNAPQPSALAALVAARESLSAKLGSDRVLVLAARPDRAKDKALLAGAEVEEQFPPFDAFGGFDLRTAVRKLAQICFGRKVNSSNCRSDPLELPYGPYGGLLLGRATVARHGTPRPEFVTYEDDSDYTRRLVTLGGYRLFLVPNSLIRDLEPSWYVQARGRDPFSRRLLSPSDQRVYLTVRNQIAFEQLWWTRHPRVRLLNALCFYVLLTIFAAVNRKPRRAAHIVQASVNARKLVRHLDGGGDDTQDWIA